MSRATKEKLFKDFAREMHKVSKHMLIVEYYPGKMIIHGGDRPKLMHNASNTTFYIVGAKRYTNIEDATLDMWMALRRLGRVTLPEGLLKRMREVYGKDSSTP